MAAPATLFEKIWDAHVVARHEGGRDLVFVDRHVLQETTCAAAFASGHVRLICGSVTPNRTCRAIPDPLVAVTRVMVRRDDRRRRQESHPGR